MDEHVFVSDEYDRMDARATELGSDMAERIADHISYRDHDWKLIARDARLLSALAAEMAELQQLRRG